MHQGLPCIEHGTGYLLMNDIAVSRAYIPGGSDGKKSACNAGDPGLIPRLQREEVVSVSVSSYSDDLAKL